LHVNGS